jgi:hypothetical protein
MLDDSTPDTAVSGVWDDESDSCSPAEEKLGGNLRSANSLTLSSLQHMKELPAIPDEQDRRRFIVRCAAF